MAELYLISPPAVTLEAFLPQLEKALAPRVARSFQLRLKHASDAEILAAGRAMLPLCHQHECAFIVNDRPDLAVEIGADGVHIGQDDMSVKDARAIVGANRIIGVTAHASRHLAMEAGDQGADYVAFGAFYPTTSKPQEKIDKWGIPAPDILHWWSELATLPCVAIGGITPANCKPLVEAGADFVAAIQAIWNDPEGPEQAVGKFGAVLKQ